MILYCLHDNKADTWSYPQTTHNAATAVREYETLAKRPDFYHLDIDLVQVACYDQNKGLLRPCDHLVLISGADYGK